MNESLPFILHILHLFYQAMYATLTQRVTDFSHTFAKLLCLILRLFHSWEFITYNFVQIQPNLLLLLLNPRRYVDVCVRISLESANWENNNSIDIDMISNSHTNFPVDESWTTNSTTHKIQCHVHKHKYKYTYVRVMLIEYTKPFRFDLCSRIICIMIMKCVSRDTHTPYTYWVVTVFTYACMFPHRIESNNEWNTAARHVVCACVIHDMIVAALNVCYTNW